MRLHVTDRLADHGFIRGKRWIGAIRLSSVTDVTTSPERQRVSIGQWAAARGDEVCCVDGRSGRLGCGVAVRADRLTRRMFDLSDLLRWCEPEKKTLATVDGFVDLSTPVGPLLVTIMVWAAQEERRLITERTREARRFARLNGNYVLGTVPYGYRAVRGEDRKLRFAEDPSRPR
jgi:site-specific DNA recombinase